MHKYLFLLLLFFISCSKDKMISPDSPEETKLSVEFMILEKEINTVADAGEKTVRIRSNTNWTIAQTPEWVKPDTLNGNGDMDMKLTWTENKEEYSRSGDIIFIAGNINDTLSIKQNGITLELVDYSGKDGKLKLSEPKYLLFNKPVTLNYLKSGEETIVFNVGENDIEYLDDGKGFKFTVGPSYLGNSYKYVYSVTDKDGVTQTDILPIPFFTSKKLIAGGLRKIRLDDKNNVWALTTNRLDGEDSDCLYEFEIVNGQLVEKLRIELDIPNVYGTLNGDFFINPYNDLVYVTNYEGKKVEIFTQTGQLVKDIPMQPDSLDHPDSPCIYPMGIGFNKSGLGIIGLGNPTSSGIRWKYIDSSRGDKMQSPSEEHPLYYEDYWHFKLNYDKSILYMIGNRSTKVKWYDTSGNFNELELGDIYQQADMVDVIPNQFNNKIYIEGLYNQQIITTDGSYKSPQSYAKGYIGDFSYDTDLSNYIYALNTFYERLELLNYNDAETIFSYPVAPFFLSGNTYYTDLKTTTDNKYLIMCSDYVSLARDSSQIVLFDIDMFK